MVATGHSLRLPQLPGIRSAAEQCAHQGAGLMTQVHGAGRLDAELTAVSRRVSKVLLNLPRDITPVNLEELRRVKQCLVELESKADNLRYVPDSDCIRSRVTQGINTIGQ